MSIWYQIKDKEEVELSEDGKTIEICFKHDYSGAHYVDVPIEFLKEIINGQIEKQKAS